MAFHLFDQVLVEHIAFGDGQQALLVEQFRIILGQFAQQDRVILADVVAVGRNLKRSTELRSIWRRKRVPNPLPS